MSPSTASGSYQGGNRLITGVVLAVITFWLFAQTTLNIAAAMRADLGISESLNNIAVSITALFSGIFIVIAGSLADRLGRVRLTNAGLGLSIAGVPAHRDLTLRHVPAFSWRDVSSKVFRPLASCPPHSP